MVRILHISDSHAQSETMARLNNLAELCSDCDVVALTGDCGSLSTRQVPLEWDAWPQALKLAVAGNHDEPNTFELLKSWVHSAPWWVKFGDLAFAGFSWDRRNGVPRSLQTVDLTRARAVVVLSHARPSEASMTTMRSMVGERALLVLHGHEHPSGFAGTEWASHELAGGRTYYRSKVCSSVSPRRGLGNLIHWDGDSFRHEEVQGPRAKGAIVHHPVFGKGFLISREGDGDGAKLNVWFGRGERRIMANYPGLRVLT